MTSPAGIIAAGGRGERARTGDARPKQFRSLSGRTLIEWSVDLLDAGGCAPIVVVLPPDADPSLVPGGVILRTGGDTRQESVRSGLEAVESDRVVVHDGARPLAPATLVRRTVEALDDHDAAVAAMPIDETLKLVSGEDVVSTIDRSGLWTIQTPQAFRTSVLRAAHAGALADGFTGTDDAGLVERYGGRVCVVRGARRNIKLTYAEDFELAEALIRRDLR